MSARLSGLQETINLHDRFLVDLWEDLDHKSQCRYDREVIGQVSRTNRMIPRSNIVSLNCRKSGTVFYCAKSWQLLVASLRQRIINSKNNLVGQKKMKYLNVGTIFIVVISHVIKVRAQTRHRNVKCLRILRTHSAWQLNRVLFF